MKPRLRLRHYADVNRARLSFAAGGSDRFVDMAEIEPMAQRLRRALALIGAEQARHDDGDKLAADESV